MDETPLQLAQRRVAEVEALVASQTARVQDLARRGQDTTKEEASLAIFEMTLRFMREDLAREQAKGQQ